MSTESVCEKSMLASDVEEDRCRAVEPGDSLVVASDGMLDLVGDGVDVDAALKFVVQHDDPNDLCARVRALAAFKATLGDITIVAIHRDLHCELPGFGLLDRYRPVSVATNADLSWVLVT